MNDQIQSNLRPTKRLQNISPLTDLINSGALNNYSIASNVNVMCLPPGPWGPSATLNTPWEERQDWKPRQSAKNVSEAFTYNAWFSARQQAKLFFDFAWACHHNSLTVGNNTGETHTDVSWSFLTWSLTNGRCVWPKMAWTRKTKRWQIRIHSLSQTLALYGLFFPPGPAVLGCAMWFFFFFKWNIIVNGWFLLYINDTV